MLELLDFPVVRPKQKQQMSTDLEKMSQNERLELFNQATDHLKRQGISFKTIAAKVHFKIPALSYKRIRNIRTDSVKTYPSVEELRAIFDTFPEELKTIRDDIGQPSPMERRVTELEEKIKEVMDFKKNEEEKMKLYARVLKLQNELEDAYKKLKQQE